MDEFNEKVFQSRKDKWVIYFIFVRNLLYDFYNLTNIYIFLMIWNKQGLF